MNEVERKAAIDPLINKIVSIFAVRVTDSRLRDDLKKQYMDGLDKAEMQFNVNFYPDLDRLQSLETYTFDLVKGMNADIAEKLRGELQRGLLNFENVSELKKRVKKVMDISIERARTIARTEMNRASNTGQLDGARQSNLKLMKRWDAHLDKRTSPVCNALDGQTIPLDSKFKWQGKVYDAPPAHPNCRSTLLYIEEGLKE